MKNLLFVMGVFMFLLSGCASAVYDYDYENGNSMHYPQSVSVGYSPEPVLFNSSNDLRLTVGADMAYLVVPMGSNINLSYRGFYAGARIGDQWSTQDNEVLGSGFTLGKNVFLGNNSVFTLGVSYTTLNLTPNDIVKGNVKGGRLVFQKVIFKDEKASGILPKVLTTFIANNIHYYDFTGTVEREHYADTMMLTDTLILNYRNYMWSVGIGFMTRFSTITLYGEIGKIFPRYMYDINNANPIRYDAYLITGMYLNF